MAICKWCNKSGIFLQITSNGLCNRCNQAIVFNVNQKGQKLIDLFKELETYYDIENAISIFKDILNNAKILLQYENKRIKTIDPPPSDIIRRYTYKKNYFMGLLNDNFKIYSGFYSRVAGITHENDDGSSRQDIIRTCSIGDQLFMQPSPFGKFKNATKLFTKDGKQIGWLTERVAGEFFNLLNDNKYKFYIEITEITGGYSDKPNLGCNIRFTCFKKKLNPENLIANIKEEIKTDKKTYLERCKEYYSEYLEVAQKLFPEYYKSLNDNSYNLYISKAIEFKKNQQFKEEKEILEKAVVNDSDSPYAYERLATILAENKEYKEAYKICKKWFDSIYWKIPNMAATSLQILLLMEELDSKIKNQKQ